MRVFEVCNILLFNHKIAGFALIGVKNITRPGNPAPNTRRGQPETVAIPLIYNVSYFSVGGLEFCLRGLSPPKLPSPRGDGTANNCCVF